MKSEGLEMHPLAQRHLRSLLFIRPGDPAALRAASRSEADAVVFDLEGLPAADVPAARRAVPGMAEQLPAGPVVLVRTDTTDAGALDDIAETLGPRVDGVVLPSIEDEGQLHWADGALSFAERGLGRPAGSFAVFVIVETARGVDGVSRILAAAPPRVAGALIGIRDLALDLGLVPSAERVELRDARSRLVVAARATDLAPPIDGPSIHHHDREGFVRDCERSRAEGFQGRVTTDPQQVDDINEAFGVHPRDGLSLVRAGARGYDREAEGTATTPSTAFPAAKSGPA